MHCSLKGHKHFLLYGTHTHKKTLFYMAFNLQFLNIRNVFNGYDASSSRFPPPNRPPLKCPKYCLHSANIRTFFRGLGIQLDQTIYVV